MLVSMILSYLKTVRVMGISQRCQCQQFVAKESRKKRNDHSKSPFGRLSLKTYNLLSMHVKDVNGRVLSYLPLDASRETRDFTLAVVLQTVLQDWTQHRNSKGLDAQDIADLGNMIELSIRLANGSSNSAKLDLEQSAVYRSVLEALMRDWLHNWNSPQV